MPKGRPSVITQAVEKKIADCFFDGLTDKETALLCNISSKTIQSARHGDKFPRIKKLELDRKRHYLAELRDGTKRDWPRIAWWLERRWPTEFAKPEIQLAINTTNQTVNQTLVVTAEVAGLISSRVKTAEKKIDDLLRLKGRNGAGNTQNGHQEPPKPKKRDIDAENDQDA